MIRRPDFVSCYNAGRRYFSKNFILFVLPRPSAQLSWRMGMAVTKKTGTAVVRNRVKRVIREFFRLNQREVCDGFDVVVVPKRSLNPERVSLDMVSQELLPIIQNVCGQLAQETGNEAP